METLVRPEAPTAGASTEAPLFLRAVRREPVPRPPVWIMRQAGRYLPEYRATRARSDFLTMVRTPELAVEVTLQPIARYGFDASIIFSDILVVPAAMGMHLTVEDGAGPVLHDPVRDAADLARLRPYETETELRYLLDAVALARRELPAHVPLIGFAGAPWTLAAYMVEGHGGKGFTKAKRLLAERPDLAHALLERLADAVGALLVAQVRAGAQAVQLFESWGDALGPDDFRAFALPYLARAARAAAATGVPVTVFAPGAWRHADAIADVTGATVLGVDWRTPGAEARALADRRGLAIQGNLDPTHLFGTPEAVRRRTLAMLEALDGRGYVANLGHGVLPETPVENVAAFVETIQGWDGSRRPALGARQSLELPST
jgi:uroporphyrinogen decarboxylase